METLRTIIVPNLQKLPDEWLDEVTADGHTFASRQWFRLLDDIDLARVTGGKASVRYVVALAGEVPVAVCPLMRATGTGLYFLYSLRTYLFEHWIEEAVRLNPERKTHFARLFRGAATYCKTLRFTGSSLEDCLIVTSPLSYRANIAVSPSSPIARPAVYQTILQRLMREARQRNLPLWFLGVEADEDSRFDTVLREAGLTRTFLFYDNHINLDTFATFDDYLASFRRTTRRAFQRDMRRTAEAGISFRFTGHLAGHAERFADLYEQTYGKYGSSHYHHEPSFWRALEQKLGDHCEAITAWHQDNLVGFSLLLKNARRGELWTYRIGRCEEGTLAEVPYYFGLSFYGPIQRAIQLGYRRIWLGPAAYEAKAVRGATTAALYNYFYFPRRLDRWFFQPYLQLFGQITQEQMERPVKSAETPVAVLTGQAADHKSSP